MWCQNLRVHHRMHKRPPPAPILSQLDPLYTTPASLPEIHSDPILPSTPWFWSCLLFLKSKMRPMRSPCFLPILQITFEPIVYFHEVWRGGHAIQGDLNAVHYNLVPSTNQKMADIPTSEMNAKLSSHSVPIKFCMLRGFQRINNF
jgi:hypothetical protein